MSLRYASYRDSGVEWLGEVPSHWDTAPLRSQFHEQTEKNEGLKSEEYLSLVAGRGVMPYAEKGDIGNKRPDDLEKCKIVRPDNFVINSMNFGIGAFGVSRYNGVCSPVYVVLQPSRAESLRFLRWIFDNRGFRQTAQSFGNGILAHRSAIGWDELKIMVIGLPPIEEQVAIAAFLDRETAKIDALIKAQRRLIALLKEKRQAVIAHTVTKGLNSQAPMKDSGIEWLGKVPAHWKVRRVKNLATLISKGTTPSTIGADFISEGLRFIKAENISGGEVRSNPEFFISEDTHALLRRSSLQGGDILVVIAGATTGKSAILPAKMTPCNTNQAVSFIRCGDIRYSRFVRNWIDMPVVQTSILLSSVQSAQPNLSMEDLGNIPLAIPPMCEVLDIVGSIT